jgi:hypothetical protein
MRYLCFVIAALLVPLPRLKAQDAPVLEPGVRVRVSTAPQAAKPAWIVGTVIAVTGDRLAIRPQHDSGGPIDIARNTVTRLELSRGRHSKALTGLGVGFLVGAGAGVILGSAVLGGGRDIAPSDAKLIGAGLVGGAGALIGLAVGAGSKSERWQPVPVTVGVMGGAEVSRYSMRVSVNLRFRVR